MYGDLIFNIGLGILGAAVLLLAVSVPTLLFTGAGLRKRLEGDYGPRRKTALKHGGGRVAVWQER